MILPSHRTVGPGPRKPCGIVRVAFWLAASLILHLALLCLIGNDPPPPSQERLRQPVEVGLRILPPANSAAPSEEPVPRQVRPRRSYHPPVRKTGRTKPSAAPASARITAEARRKEVLPPGTNPPRTSAIASRPAPGPEPPAASSRETASLQPARTSPSPPVNPAPTASEETTQIAAPAVPLPESSVGAAPPQPDRGSSSREAPLVEARPRYDSNVPPPYPRVARLRGWEGLVLVRVTVGTDGRPDAVTVHRSSGFALLDDAAVRAVRKWRFQPARRGERPVVDEVMVPLRFELRR